MSSKGREFLDKVLAEQKLLGTREFYLSRGQFVALIEWGLRGNLPLALRLNRPQVGTTRLLHRAAWRGVTFYCVSPTPLLIW